MAVVEACSRRLSIASCNLAPSSASAGSQEGHSCVMLPCIRASSVQAQAARQAPQDALVVATASLLGALLSELEAIVAASSGEETRDGCRRPKRLLSERCLALQNQTPKVPRRSAVHSPVMEMPCHTAPHCTSFPCTSPSTSICPAWLMRSVARGWPHRGQ